MTDYQNSILNELLVSCLLNKDNTNGKPNELKLEDFNKIFYLPASTKLYKVISQQPLIIKIQINVLF
jgi:hypothetical protein